MKKYQNLDEVTLEMFKENPALVDEYLNVIIEDYNEFGDDKALLSSLRIVAEAKGGVAKVAKEAAIDRESLYRLFRGNIVPKVDTFRKILKGLGFSLALQHI